MPMSIKDLIWVTAAQALQTKNKEERKIELFNYQQKALETLNLTIADCRSLLVDASMYLRLCAYKDTKVKKIDGFDIKTLPSMIVEEKQKEEERRKNMTPEEIQKEEIDKFMRGETIYS
jgi:hypothetical protein